MELRACDKYVLTIQEATMYFQIGENKLRSIIAGNPNADFILYNGNRILIKRTAFEKYIDKHSHI